MKNNLVEKQYLSIEKQNKTNKKKNLNCVSVDSDL